VLTRGGIFRGHEPSRDSCGRFYLFFFTSILHASGLYLKVDEQERGADRVREDMQEKGPPGQLRGGTTASALITFGI